MDQQNQQPVTSQEATPQQPTQQVTQPQWQYQSGQLEQTGTFDQPQDPQSVTDSETQVSWTASEFVSHEKNGGWYAMLIAGALVLGLGIFFLTKEWFSIVAIAVLAIAVGMFGNLRPRVLNYEISPDGILVGEKRFSFDEFRSFAVIEEGMPNIQLLPQKRFMMSITMYLDPAQGDHIVEVLGDYLPFEHRERDFVDKLTSRFHF